MPELVTIATYSTPEEAAVPRVALDAAGIATYLEGVATVGNLWEFASATGGIKLQVEDVDVEAALAVLENDRSQQPMAIATVDNAEVDQASTPVAKIASTPSQHCPTCGEPAEPGFEVCWSCGADIDAPPVEPLADAEEEAADTADLSARQAWRTAAIAFLCPAMGTVLREWKSSEIGLMCNVMGVLLGTYALWLLFKPGRNREMLSARGRRHVVWAEVLASLAMLPAVVLIARIVINVVRLR
ncbi:MAG: zinc ribbon domain-containing protein [Planctomycetia bacterium]|nr:zinc ribbon domain-containing protein [Planctomycetia bacterium]